MLEFRDTGWRLWRHGYQVDDESASCPWGAAAGFSVAPMLSYRPHIENMPPHPGGCRGPLPLLVLGLKHINL